MIERSTNLNDFLLLVPCCGALLFAALVVGGVLLALQWMGRPEGADGGAGRPSER